MKLCLINLKFESNEITNFRRQEHTGLGYIGAVCKNAGHEVYIINAQFENIDKCEVLRRIVEYKPDVIGISVYEELLSDTVSLIENIKENDSNTTVIIGGHYATFNSENLLKSIPGIDFIVLGEGEISFPRLLSAINKSQSPDTIKGISYRQGSNIISTGFSDSVDNLDDLPYPIRAEIDRSDKITNMSASRGCYGNCSFCSTNSFYRKHNCKSIRTRNPLKVVDEIEYIVKNFKAYHIFFTDDNFLVNEKLNPGWINTFVNEVENRDLNIVFNFDCRVDDIDEELFAKLKKIGLIGVFVGVESNSAKTLELYNKSTSRSKNIEAINKLRKLRIDYWTGNILYHPLTTLEDIYDDIKFFEDIHYHLYFNYSNPVTCLAGRLKIYRGTDIFDKLSELNILKNNELTCEYNFFDDRIDAFFNFVQTCKKLISPLVELDSVFMVETANKAGKADLASKIHSISRKYMKLDFIMFKTAHGYLHFENQTIDDFMISSRELIDKNIPIINELYTELKKLKEQVDVLQVY